jgi:SAM-dependent methyltransferase
MQKQFVHPFTKAMLEKDAEDNLVCRAGDRQDVYRSYNGCYDFSVANPSVQEARFAYDRFYASDGDEMLTLDEVTQAWSDGTVPWRKTMLQALGSLSGRRVLLLGNGASYKEFYFLHLGAQVVFTDLSLVAVRRAQVVFRGSELWPEHRDDIEFHAVDAMHLPFPDQSFDVIYGSKFVGFLDNTSYFFSEVKRCLKPGGVCRFADDASSPVWERVRQTLVHPVKARFSKASKSSLAGVRSASRFGFDQESLTPLLRQHGFSRLVFIREYFFLRVAQLCMGKLLRWNAAGLRYAKPLFLTMKWLDDRLANTAWMRRNHLALTWGFDK